jgi:hypothetical protein
MWLYCIDTPFQAIITPMAKVALPAQKPKDQGKGTSEGVPAQRMEYSEDGFGTYHYL